MKFVGDASAFYIENGWGEKINWISNFEHIFVESVKFTER